MCRDFEECPVACRNRYFFLKVKRDFQKKRWENCPPFRVLKAFFFFVGDEFSVVGGEEFIPFSFVIPTPGQKESRF